MKPLFAALIIAFCLTGLNAQNEAAPAQEKDIVYKDWVFKNVATGRDMNLRKFTFDKKLVMVVYFAPWCPNWKHDAPVVNRLYEKYKKAGFDVIGVSEYDTTDAAKANLASYNVAFPIVSESELRTDKQKTSHYEYRRSTGDTRSWGSPWYIFLESTKLEKEGLVLTKRTTVVNGELIEAEIDKMIAEKLGIASKATAELEKSGKIEICEPDEKTILLEIKP
ncbi:MAG: TlpA disulfide reductase family protein [Acidobacteriota bacterium]